MVLLLKLCWSNLVFSAGTWSYTSSSTGCCFYNMTVPVNPLVLCSVLLQAIIFFHSIQLIFGRVDSSFSVPITLPNTQVLFIPWDLVKNLKGKCSLEVKMILYQRKCVRSLCSCAVNVAFFNQEPCFYWSHAHLLLMHEISNVMHFDDFFTQPLWKVMLAYDDKRFSAGNFVWNLCWNINAVKFSSL